MTVARFPVPGNLRSESGSSALAPYVLTSSSLSVAYSSGVTLQLGRPLTVKPNLYIGVDVGTTSCEIATVQSVSGGTITITSPGLLLAHPAGAVVQVVQGSEVPAWWFGIAADGVTDDTAGWQQALSRHTAVRALWINAAGTLGLRSSVISQPIVRSDSAKIRQTTFIASPSFSPADCSNAMLMSQNFAGSPSDTLTFTAAAGAVTTPVAHGLVQNLQVMFKNTAGTLVGAVEGRSYYACNVTTTTFQLASTLALANAGTSDVNITAGAGTVYLQVGQKGRQFYDDVYLNASHVPGVNGIIDNLQQPGFANKLRIDNCVAAWGTLTPGASSFSGIVYYMIVGVDSAGNFWRTAEVTMSGNRTPDSSHQVVLSWGSLAGMVSGAVTWNVYRVSASGTEQTVNSLVASGLTSTTFTDTGAAPSAGTCPFLQRTSLNAPTITTAGSSFNGSARYWVVAAVDASGNKLASNEVTASPTNAQQVKLTWDAYPDAVTWNVYRSSTPNGESGANTLVTSGLSSTTLTFTDNGAATGAGSVALSAGLHPGGFGLYVAGQQYVWMNFESIACDTGVKCGAAEFLWFFGFDIESCALRAVHAVPLSQHLLNVVGAGILSAMFYGVHHEMPSNYVACYDFEGTALNVVIDTIQWSAGGQTSSPTGGRGAAFVYQHANQSTLTTSGYQMRNMSMTTPSAAGTYLVFDADRALFLDSWTNYHQNGPRDLVIPEASSSSTFSQQPFGYFGAGGRSVQLGSAQTADPAVTISPGNLQTGAQFVTNDQVTGLPTFQVLATGQTQLTSATFEATGAGSAALGANSPAVTNTAPYKWLKLKTSDGSTVFIPAWK